MSRYVRIEDWRVNDTSVSHAEFRLYCRIRSWCRSDTTVRASLSDLAKDSGVTDRTVRRHLDALIECGWVQGSVDNLLVDAPPGRNARTLSVTNPDTERHESGRLASPHTSREYHETKRPSVLCLEDHESRVVALLRVASNVWPFERDKAHEWLDGFQRQLARGSQLTERQLVQLERLEERAKPSRGRLEALAERSRREADERRRLKELALRDRKGTA